MEFVTDKIDNIANLKAGGDAPKNVSSIRTNEFCYPIFSNGISNKGLYGYTNKYTMPANTLTVSARGTIGAVFYRTEPYLPIVRLISITPNEDVILPKYMYYLLNSIPIEGFGSVQQQLTIPFYKKTKITFAKDIKIQDKIACILSTYDDLIEKNNRKIEILQDMAEELYKEWFVRFRFPGYKTAKFTEGFPEGWQVKSLNDVCQITTGNKDANQATGEGMYPFFTCARETTLTTDEYILDTNAILVSGNGSYTGFVKKYSGKFDLYQRTYALYDFNDIDWLYLYWVMKTDFEPKHMGGTNGAAIPYITKPVLQRYKLLVPTADLLDKAGKIFSYCHEQCNLLEKQNINLKQQRDLLLPRLMSGKLEVKVKQEV